jgi:hypothetical protein
MACMMTPTDIRTGDPTGLHRVLDDRLVLPQAAQRLDTRAELWPDEVRVRVERLNLDAASFRQLERKHTKYGETDGGAVRASRTIGVVPHQGEHDLLAGAGVADVVAVADARDPIALRDAVTAAGGPADVTVVCVDVPGCEGGAILATADGGTVIFFSMATSFSAAALGAEGLAADVRMLVGNGYVPGHAAYAMELLRADAGVRGLFERRL